MRIELNKYNDIEYCYIWLGIVCPVIACVASVPVRSKRNFTFGPHEKWGESKKVEGRGWGRGRKGPLARKPLVFEKRPLAFTVEFMIDNFVTELKSQ